MFIIDVAEQEKRARDQFTYQTDGAIDTWLSHADDVIANKPWLDDCDGLAETILDLCVRAGLPKENAYRGAVDAENGAGGHMVGYVKTTDERFWVVGDTYYNGPYPVEQMRHKPVVYNRLSEEAWRSGAPFKLEKI